MQEAEIGWIAAIIVGGLAGWFAEMFMKSGTGIFEHRPGNCRRCASKLDPGTSWNRPWRLDRLSHRRLYLRLHHHRTLASY